MFIIPCKYSVKSNYVISLVEQIRSYHFEELIMVVDSNSNDKSYYDHLNKYNVIVEDVDNKNWAVGAFWHGFKKYPNEEFYFCLHDSMKVKSNLDHLKEKDLILLANFNREVSESFNAWNEKIKNETLINHIFIKKNGKGCYGPLFGCKNKILKQLLELKCDKLLPSNKNEIGYMEGAFGLFFESLGYNLDDYTLFGDILELESGAGRSGKYPHNTSWQFPIEKFYGSHFDNARK